MYVSFLNRPFHRYFGSVNNIRKLQSLSNQFLECIDKYKKEKLFSIELYKNQKKELKECFNQLFNKELHSLNEKDLITILTYSILLCRRILIPEKYAKNVLLQYISLQKESKSSDHSSTAREKIDKAQKKEEIVLVAKYLHYLNVEYDQHLFNYLYSEWNNTIELYKLEDLIEIANLISSFKNRNWVNPKFFSRCINEIIKKTKEQPDGEKQLPLLLVPVIKSCTRIGYDIDNIKTLLDQFIRNYKKGDGKEIGKEMEMVEEHIISEDNAEESKSNYTIYSLIKILYNLFLCNYYNSKCINPLINLLKEELLPTGLEEDYPSHKKYSFNENLVIDNNYNMNPDFNNNYYTNNPSVHICNDTINKIHEMYFKPHSKDGANLFKHNNAIRSINLYRLKFLDMVIRSDSYLYNSFYLPNAHFWDHVKQLQFQEKMSKETIFSRQVTFFLKENGFQLDQKKVVIYSVFCLTNTKNTCVEFVHDISINKKMKDSPNKFHKYSLNYKLKHLKFLGWNVLLLYEHEWKKLRSFNEKYIYVKQALENVK